MKKIDRSKQIEAVQNFCKNLPDGKEFTICVMIMKGVPENKVRKRMHMNKKAWEEMKKTIGDGLKKSGVQLRAGGVSGGVVACVLCTLFLSHCRVVGAA